MSNPPTWEEEPQASPSAIGHIDPVFSGQRLSYTDGPSVEGLDVGNLSPSPLLQFRRWYDESLTAGVTEPTP